MCVTKKTVNCGDRGQELLNPGMCLCVLHDKVAIQYTEILRHGIFHITVVCAICCIFIDADEQLYGII